MTTPDFWQQNYDLSRRNTLAIPSRAEWYAEVGHEQQLRETVTAAQQHNLTLKVLGGGSNILCAETISGLVLHPVCQGITIKEQGDAVFLTVAAGENWHHLVEWSLQHGYFGLENLALIPGNTGAAPIQNIGAYGVELSDSLQSVCWFDFKAQRFETISAADCQLSYRDSIFKRKLKNQGLIWSVTLMLAKRPSLTLSYGPLQKLTGQQPSPQDVFNTVCELRRAKLPDPTSIPNAGSFFKNPVVEAALFEPIQRQHPSIPHFSAGKKIKIPAAWLIDQAGLKGQEVAGLVVHAQQALVLTNPKRLSMAAVSKATRVIQQQVLARFGIALEVEPQLFE